MKKKYKIYRFPGGRGILSSIERYRREESFKSGIVSVIKQLKDENNEKEIKEPFRIEVSHYQDKTWKTEGGKSFQIPCRNDNGEEIIYIWLKYYGTTDWMIECRKEDLDYVKKSLKIVEGVINE